MNLRIKIVLCSFCILIAAQVQAGTRYPKAPVHSPITASIATHLKSVVLNGSGQNNNVFMIVGDSLSTGREDGENAWFLGQFEYPYATGNESGWVSIMDLKGYEELQPAHAFFKSAVVPHRTAGQASTSPYARYSLAARVSMGASWAITGDPSPLQQEIDAINPKFAIIMYGSNDVSSYGGFPVNIDVIIGNILKIIDVCISQGIVPVVTAPHIRYGYDDACITLQYALRAACQDRQVPYINYLKTMVPLPDHGLGNNHDVHPKVLAWNRACVFHPEALDYGRNLRNLITLQSFDRMYQIFQNNEPSLNPEPPALAGNGTANDPYIVDEIAFVDSGETTSGRNEFFYQLTITEGFDLRTIVTCQDDADIDVSLLDDQFNLLATHDLLVERTINPGTYYVRVENSGADPAKSGKYQLVIMNTDLSFPSVPGNFTASAISSQEVQLNWNVATDNKGVAGYKIYRNQKELAVTDSTSFVDQGLTPSTSYTYAVTSCDSADNESFHTPLVHVETGASGDPVAPLVPQNLTILSISPD